MKSILRRVHAHRSVEVFIIRFVLPCVRWGMRVPLLEGIVYRFYEWTALALVAQLDSGTILSALGALESEGIDYYLAGGFGIDALVGTMSCFHGDLDIVLDRYAEQIETAIAVIERYGFHQIEPHPNLMWMTATAVLVDGDGRMIELVALDAGRVVAASKTLGNGAVIGDPEGVTSNGEIFGKAVRCLSLRAQLVLQRGKPLRPKDLHNMRRIAKMGR
jgi:lincosamide nucleotidyltransferase A/C/D/E